MRDSILACLLIAISIATSSTAIAAEIDFPMLLRQNKASTRLVEKFAPKDWLPRRTMWIKQDNISPPDLLITDPKLRVAYLCEQGNADKCRAIHTNGADILVISGEEPGTDELLVQWPGVAGEICRVSSTNNELRCSPTTAKTFQRQGVRSTVANGRGVRTFRLSDGTENQCGEFDGVLSCTGARQFQKTANGQLVLAGDFRNHGVPQILTVGDVAAKLCAMDNNGNCVTVVGLPALSTVSSASQLRIRSGNKDVLVLATAEGIQMCAIAKEAENRITFSCLVQNNLIERDEWEFRVLPALGRFEERLAIIPSPVKSAKRITGATASLPQRNTITSALTQHVSLNAMAAHSLTQVTDLFAPTYEPSEFNLKKAPSTNDFAHVQLYDEATGNFEGALFPTFNQFDSDSDPWVETYWSDSFGYYFWDFGRPCNMPIPVCKTACDVDAMDAEPFCSGLSLVIGGAGVVLTAGATIGFTTATGGIGGMAGMTIVRAGAFITGGLAAAGGNVCRGAYQSRREQCKLECESPICGP